MRRYPRRNKRWSRSATETGAATSTSASLPEATHRVDQRDAKKLRTTARTAEKPNIIPVDVRRRRWGALAATRAARTDGIDAAFGSVSGGGAAVHVLLRAAELHARSRGGDDGPAADPQRHDDGDASESPAGLVAAESTLASVLKNVGYSTIQIGQWHLRRRGLRDADRARVRRDAQHDPVAPQWVRVHRST
jgi:hypothetical protein